MRHGQVSDYVIKPILGSRYFVKLPRPKKVCVYVVFFRYYDTSEIFGVFTTLRKARNAQRKKPKSVRTCIEIKEVPLDELGEWT